MTLHNLILQFLAGLIVIGSLINMPAWGKLLYQRLRDPARRCWYRDPYVFVRAGMLIHGPAVAAAYAWWGIHSFLGGNPALHPFGFYFVTRSLVALAEAFFIRSAYLFGVKRPAFVWVGCVSLWSGFCLYWGVS